MQAAEVLVGRLQQDDTDEVGIAVLHLRDSKVCSKPRCQADAFEPLLETAQSVQPWAALQLPTNLILGMWSEPRRMPDGFEIHLETPGSPTVLLRSGLLGPG